MRKKVSRGKVKTDLARERDRDTKKDNGENWKFGKKIENWRKIWKFGKNLKI